VSGKLKRFVIGQPLGTFPGGTLNALIDDYNKRQDIVPTQPAVFVPPPAASATVKLVWDDDDTPLGSTNTIIEPGMCVILNDPVLSAEEHANAPYEGVQFKCRKATSEDALETAFFAITSTPFYTTTSEVEKSVGWGYIPNACWAQVNVTDEDHEQAALADGETLLQSAESGRVPIVWKPTGTGTKWCVVALSPGGGTSGVQGALAIIKGTVPASSAISVTGTLTDASDVVTPGTLAASATADTFTAGALLVNSAGNPIFVDGELRAVDVLNPSISSFIGEGNGVFVAGSLITEGENEYFLLPTSETRTRTGYDETKGNLVMVQPDDGGAESIVGGWSANDKSLGATTSGDAEWQDDGACD